MKDIKDLADRLGAEPDPTEADIDREALRIVNLARYKSNQVNILHTLSPIAQEHYREIARLNLGAVK